LKPPWDYEDSSIRESLIERIVEVAVKKSSKDYFTVKGSSLVFVLYTPPYFGMGDIEHKDAIDLLIQKLKAINFNVQSTYLLLLPKQRLIEIA